jgi:hypothetical protein
MIDHAPWRDLDAAVYTLAHLPDRSVLRLVPTQQDNEVLDFVLRTSEFRDLPAQLVREYPGWCLVAAMRAEIAALSETVQGIQRAMDAGVDVPAVHADLANALGRTTVGADPDADERWVTEVASQLRHLAGPQIQAWSNLTGHRILGFMMVPAGGTPPQARVPSDRMQDTVDAALRSLLARVWPTGTTDIGEPEPPVELSGLSVTSGALVLTALTINRAVAGFRIRVAYAVQPAGEPVPAPHRVRRSYQWPGPVLTVDDAGFAYTLLHRAHGSHEQVELTYAPALSPLATVVRLRADRYELHEFALPVRRTDRPERTVTYLPIDLELAVPIPRPQ